MLVGFGLYLGNALRVRSGCANLCSDDHRSFFDRGSQAVQAGELALARTLFQRAHDANPTTQTALILDRLELLDVDKTEIEDDQLINTEHAIDGGRLTIVTLGEPEDATGATAGGGLWASAPVLVDWLCMGEPPSASSSASTSNVRTTRRDDWLKGKSVVELGSGSGFVGLALAKLGASRVLLTDLPQKLPLLRRNVVANGGGALPVDTAPLVWGAKTVVHDWERGWDLVVASDVTYDAELVPPLATTISALMHSSLDAGRSPRALLALPRRSHFQPPVTVVQLEYLELNLSVSQDRPPHL